jgi:hypothetical protein
MYDLLLGLDVWRQKDESGLYDCRVLRKRTNDIKWMIEQGDIFNLMFRIRGGLARDMYGMQHEGLFSKAAAGTKVLVEDYHSTVAASLNYICDSTADEVYLSCLSCTGVLPTAYCLLSTHDSIEHSVCLKQPLFIAHHLILIYLCVCYVLFVCHL